MTLILCTKIILAMLCGFVLAWFHNLKHDSILHFCDLNFRLISHFIISIHAKKSTTKLFVIRTNL